jgi:hypothetical protein
MTTKKTKTQNEDPQTEASLLPVTPAPEAANLTATQALIMAVNGCQNVSAQKVNPHFRSKYFGLAELLDIVKPTFAKYGLAVIQIPSTLDGRISIRAAIYHTSGECFHFDSVGIKSEGLNLPALGSAMSYLKRYQLATLCGVAAELEDDDGSSVSKQQQSYASSVAKQQTSPAAQPASNHQRADDSRREVSFDWLTTDAEKKAAEAILVRKGWLPDGAPLEALAEAHINTLRQPSMRAAFAKAVETELSQTNG